MVLCLLGTESCRRHRPGANPGEYASFDDFISSVRSATWDDYRGKPGVQVESAAAFEEMKAHLLSLYDSVTPTHSFAEGHQVVDCVPLAQQPGLRRPGAAREQLQREGPVVTSPPPPPAVSGAARTGNTMDLTLKSGVKDSRGAEMYCSTGTIPMRRITLEEMTRFKTLRSFFTKGSRFDNFDPHQPPPRGNLPADDSSHYYARGVQFVDNFGADSWLNVWNPTVATDQMSLSQIWIVGGDGTSKQTAESGWQVLHSKYGDNAGLFIYYTTAGYSDGCYNLECSAFIQVANNIYSGRNFDHYSTTGGTQWGFNLQWKRSTAGDWWLFYRGPGDYIAVGYYPHSLYGNGTMATQAGKIAFGGEDTGKPSALQMGSGQKASAGWQQAAYQNRIFYIDTHTVSQWAKLDSQDTPGCYTTDINNDPSAWGGTYLFFGGSSCN
jgi:hypothetical protein